MHIFSQFFDVSMRPCNQLSCFNFILFLRIPDQILSRFSFVLFIERKSEATLINIHQIVTSPKSWETQHSLCPYGELTGPNQECFHRLTLTWARRDRAGIAPGQLCGSSVHIFQTKVEEVFKLALESSQEQSS